ncbi:DUF805 domain-containing protein [Brevundimonas faecalis]|uniref:Uncharacterized membrane protein YhaH (DUF805 family) n=1 Tax=Brevundimonas faecalis TaxID=947378 RepID=A0ABV2RB00_9CAUL
MSFLNQRINRATYWLFIALIMAFAFVISFFNAAGGGTWVVVAMAYIMRLHDLGRTGKWVLLVFAVQFAAGIAVIFADASLHQIGFGLVTLASLAFTIWLGSIKGQPHANLYGQAPGPGIRMKANAKAPA